MITIEKLVYRIEGEPLINMASAKIQAGTHVALVGRNGSGKTTLFRLITGQLEADSGSITLRARTRIGQVTQEAPGGDIHVIDFVLAADTERTDLLAEIENDPTPERLAEIHERLIAISAHSAHARAASILHGLGFDHDGQNSPLSSFSGGWRMRVALAATLFSRPDLLLLDEPTNHLDLESALWLQNHLRRFDGTLLVISHDRDFLNKIPSAILHLQGKKLTLYGGNYDKFEKTRRMQMDLARQTYAKQMAQRDQIMQFVNRFRYKASKARQAQSRLKLLEKVDMVVPVVETDPICFNFPQPGELSPPLVRIEHGATGYGNTTVLRRLNFSIEPDDRIALLGANGNGKSTLAKLITGRLPLFEGTIHTHKHLETGYFAQHQFEEISPSDTAVSSLAELLPDKTDEQLRSHAGRFGFSGPAADREAKKLSGGEKARLLLARMCTQKPNLLILDEPTNHLDIDSRQSLQAALNAFEGAVILITHDTHLIKSCADRLWLVAENTCKPFDGDVADYENWLLTRDKGDKTKKATSGVTGKKAGRIEAAALREKLRPLQNKIAKTEKKMAELAKENTKIENLLANPRLYETQDSESIAALQVKLGENAGKLEDLETYWLDDQEQLENLQS